MVKRSTNKTFKWLMGLVLLCVIAAATGYYVYQSKQPTISYATEVVKRETIEDTVLAGGVVNAKELVEVGSQATGQVKRLYVELGQQVKKGQRIADIDAAQQRNQLQDEELAYQCLLNQQRLRQANLKQASISDQQALYLSLSANAVRSYFALANLNQRIALADATLAHDQQLQNMLKIQLKAGRIAPIDKVTLAQTINQHRQNRQSLINQKNELLANMALAMGDNLGALSAKFPTLTNVRPSNRHLPAIAIGLPAQVLANRPDIQTAVWRLKQAFAQADIAQNNLYPNIVLTAGAATASPELHQLLSLPVLSWGLAVNLPPLNPQEARRTLQSSDIATQQAVLTYQETLYKALADVEAKLSQYHYQQQQRQLIEQNYQLTEQLTKANQLRYQAGTISLKQLLEAQEDSRQALLGLADAEYQQQLAWVNLQQALG